MKDPIKDFVLGFLVSSHPINRMFRMNIQIWCASLYMNQHLFWLRVKAKSLWTQTLEKLRFRVSKPNTADVATEMPNSEV